MKTRILSIGWSLLTLCAGTISAWSQSSVYSPSSFNLLAWDSFEYPSDTQVVGQNGGFGWTSPWAGGNPANNFFINQPSSLVPAALPQYPTAGGSAAINLLAPYGLNYINRTLNLTTTNYSEVWFSAVVSPSGGHMQDRLQFFWSTNDSNASFELDAYSPGGSDPPRWFIGQSLTNQGPLVVPNRPTLLVLRITNAPLSPFRVDLFVEPPPGLTPPSPNLTFVGTKYKPDRIESLWYVISGSGTPHAIDELRFATNYAAVVGFRPPRVPVITGFSPAHGVTGDIITISGSGFGDNPDNLSVTAVGQTTGFPPLASLRVLSATDTQITARLGTVPPPTGVTDPPVLMVQLGQGSVGPLFPPIPDMHGGEDTWVWLSQEAGAAVTSPFQTIYTPPGPGQQFSYGQVSDGALSVFISGNWGPGLPVEAELHFNAGGTACALQERTVTLVNGSTALDGANLIKAMLVDAFSQRAGLQLPVDVDVTGPDLVKMTIHSPNGLPITSGLLNILRLTCRAELLKNPSFEEPGLPDIYGHYAVPGDGDAFLPHWTTLTDPPFNNGVEYYTPIPSDFPEITLPDSVSHGAAADGVYALDLAPASGTGGGIQQTFTTEVGKAYHVFFKMGTAKPDLEHTGNAHLTAQITGDVPHERHMATESPTLVWELKDFDFTATATSYTLVFSSPDDPLTTFVNLDDAHVTECDPPYCITSPDDPPDVHAECTNRYGTVVTFPTPTAINRCNPANPVTPSLNHQSGDTFPLGTTPVTCIFTSPGAPPRTYTFAVIVEDTTPPVFTNCPLLDKTVECGTQWTFDDPGAFDACCLAGVTFQARTNELTCDYAKNGKVRFIYEGTWTATDCAGNSTNCTQIVSAEDHTPPRFTSCPRNKIVRVDASGRPPPAFSRLYSFVGDVGITALVEGRDGVLYGTTERGGSHGAGTVFKVNKDGRPPEVFFNFDRSLTPEGFNFESPRTLLEGSDGLLYGVCDVGWPFSGIFKLNKVNRVLSSVRGQIDNNFAVGSSLVEGRADGFLYCGTFGQAINPGTPTDGIILRLYKDGSSLAELAGFPPYKGPNTLLEGSDDFLYATTEVGGTQGRGTVIKVQKDGGTSPQVLVTFGTVGTEAIGALPNSLIEGSDGMLYGATRADIGVFYGTIFRVSKDGLDPAESLHQFTGLDGANPSQLIEGRDGALYVVTAAGGSQGRGTIFRMNKNGSDPRVLYSFDEPAGYPHTLLQGSDGALYGTDAVGVFRFDPEPAWDLDQPTAWDACSGTNVTITELPRVTNDFFCSKVFTRTWYATDCAQNSITNCTQTVTLLPEGGCLTLSLSTAIAGETFTASGTVLPGTSGVRALWDDGSTWRVIGQGVTGPDGSFQLNLAVPADAPVGRNYMRILPSGSSGSDMGTVPFDVLATPPGVLGGVVTGDAIGQPGPIQNVLVRLYDWRGIPVGSAVTLQDGSFSFPNLPPGNYHAILEDASHYFPDLDVHVGSGLNVAPPIHAAIPPPCAQTHRVQALAIPTAFSLFQSPQPAIAGDTWRSPFARLPALPEGAGSLFVRLWADVYFPPPESMPGTRQVEFQLVDPAGTVLWTRSASRVEHVYPLPPFTNDGWVIEDFNVHILPPGDSRLIVTPIVGSARCTPMTGVIHMDDMIRRWYQPWVRRGARPLQAQGSGAPDYDLAYHFTATLPDAPSPLLQANFVVPVFDKLLRNEIDAGVRNLMETFNATTPHWDELPGDTGGLFPAPTPPTLAGRVTLLDYDLFERNFPFAPVLGADGRLDSYTLPNTTAVGPSTLFTVPIFDAGPGIGCVKLCFIGCRVCAGWKVTVNFSVSGKIDVASTIRNDLSLVTDITPEVDATLGGHVAIKLVIVSADADVTGTLAVRLPFEYDSQPNPDSVGFLDPCVTISGSVGAHLDVLGLDFGGGATLGPATIYGCTGGAGGARMNVMSSASPTQTDPAPAVAANGAGGAMTVWVQDEGPSGATSPFVYYSTFDGANWSQGQRLTPAPALVVDPKVGFLSSTQALAVWFQNRTPLADILAQGETDLSLQELYWSRLDGGQTWSTPAALTDDTSAEGNVSLAIDRAHGRALAAWERQVINPGDSNVFVGVAVAFFDGIQWSPIQMVDYHPPDIDAQISAAFDAQGNAWLAWVRHSGGDLTDYSKRRMRVAHELPSPLGAWVAEDLPGPLAAFSPSLALDVDGHPVIAFTVPPMLDGTPSSGFGNMSTLWAGRNQGNGWQFAQVASNIFCESPVLRINSSNQATIMFRGFAGGTPDHSHGDLAAAGADLRGPWPIPWSTGFLTDDDQTNWKTDFDVDGGTGRNFVVNVKQPPISSAGAGKTARAAATPSFSPLFSTKAAGDAPSIVPYNFANLPDLVVTADDIVPSNRHPFPQDNTIITATVRNAGLGPVAGPFAVAFYADEIPFSLPFAQVIVSNTIPFNGSVAVQAPFVPAHGGLQVVRVTVDAASAVAESNEGNNTAQITFGMPDTPANVVAYADLRHGLIRLAWSVDDTKGIARYWVYRSTGANGPEELIGSTVGSTFTDSFFIPGVEYSYSIRAQDGLGAASGTGRSVAVVFSPGLRVTRHESWITIAWSAQATGFILQESASLNPTAWTDVNLQPVVAGQDQAVTLSAESGIRFYRLVKR